MYNRYMQSCAGRAEAFGQTEEPLRGSNSPAEKKSVGLGSVLSGLLGSNVEFEDILLYLILLLLYLEKKDEEILIALAALIVMNFQSEVRKQNHPEQ